MQCRSLAYGRHRGLDLLKSFYLPNRTRSFCHIDWICSFCTSLITYGEKMSKDLFDGTKGFAIEGGLKDASYVNSLLAYNFLMTTPHRL
jgi:hypothetical protein